VIPAFTRFAAIDWSGAKGKRHKGIAIAMCGGGAAPPALVRPDHIWSRTEVLDWLLAAADEVPTLFGFDFCSAPPIAERGEYLPGEDAPADARSFWAYVDRLSDDEDLGAASFLERVHRRHFYFGAADGAKRDFLIRPAALRFGHEDQAERLIDMRWNRNAGHHAALRERRDDASIGLDECSLTRKRRMRLKAAEVGEPQTLGNRFALGLVGDQLDTLAVVQ